MPDLISFLCASRRLENVREMLDNFEQTAADYSCFEVVIKFDEDHEGALEFIEAEAKKRPFTVKYLVTPRLEGQFSLGLATEQIFFLSDPDTYFVQFVSDEVRFKTKHWDKVLRRYVKFFPDDIFRIRLSLLKHNSYPTHYECTFRPDSFAIFTRKWLELSNGMGDCWASDAYQQCVTYHLLLGPGAYNNTYRVDSIWRDFPIFDIELDGIDWGVGVSGEELRERHRRNLVEWDRLTCFPMQERFSYYARRIFCYIKAHEMGWDRFYLRKNPIRKTVSVVLESGEEVFEVSYAVQRLLVYTQNIRRRIVNVPGRILSMLYHGSRRAIARRCHWPMKPVYMLYRGMIVLLRLLHKAFRLVAKAGQNTLWFFEKAVKAAIYLCYLIPRAILHFCAISLRLLWTCAKVALIPMIRLVLKSDGSSNIASSSLFDYLPKPIQLTVRSILSVITSIKLKTNAISGHAQQKYIAFHYAMTRFFTPITSTVGSILRAVVDSPLSIENYMRKGGRNFKRLAKKILNELWIDANVPFHAVFNHLDRVLMPPAPGLDVLTKKNVRLPPRVKYPSQADIEWGRAALAQVESERLALDQKLFVLHKSEVEREPVQICMALDQPCKVAAANA